MYSYIDKLYSSIDHTEKNIFYLDIINTIDTEQIAIESEHTPKQGLHYYRLITIISACKIIRPF